MGCCGCIRSLAYGFSSDDCADASVNVSCTVVYNCTNGTFESDETCIYSGKAIPESGTLTVNFSIDGSLLKR